MTEVTKAGNQSLTVTFDDGPVNIHAIHLLDLFANEGAEEKAVSVPIPSAFWMFGTALIGFVAMSRRIRV